MSGSTATSARRGPSMLVIIGLVGILATLVAVVIFGRSLPATISSPDLSISIPAPAAGPAQVPNVAPAHQPAQAAGDGMQAAVASANQASAGIGQALVSWFLLADLVLALLGLFGLLLGGLLHGLYVARGHGRAVLLSVGIAEGIFLLAPVTLLLVLRALSWAGGMLVSGTSSSLPR